MTTILLNLIFSIPTEWRQPNYDQSRSNRTPAVGQIDRPKLSWEADLRGQEYLWSGSLGEGRFSPSLSKNLFPLSIESQQAWGIVPSKLDVTGNGRLIDPPAAPGARWGKFLPEVDGLQRISWTTTWGKDAHFHLHSFENGIENPTKIWDVKFQGDIY